MQGVISYKVTVEAVVEREEMQRQWTTIDHEPIPGDERLKPIMGYTPAIQKTVQKEIKIYEQTVESLDMTRLVLVVNDPDPQ